MEIRKITFIIAIGSAVVIFQRMRETQEYTFMPFGPPLVAATFLMMFFSENIVISFPY